MNVVTGELSRERKGISFRHRCRCRSFIWLDWNAMTFHIVCVTATVSVPSSSWITKKRQNVINTDRYFCTHKKYERKRDGRVCEWVCDCVCVSVHLLFVINTRIGRCWFWVQSKGRTPFLWVDERLTTTTTATAATAKTTTTTTTAVYCLLQKIHLYLGFLIFICIVVLVWLNIIFLLRMFVSFRFVCEWISCNAWIFSNKSIKF